MPWFNSSSIAFLKKNMFQNCALGLDVENWTLLPRWHWHFCSLPWPVSFEKQIAAADSVLLPVPLDSFVCITWEQMRNMVRLKYCQIVVLFSRIWPVTRGTGFIIFRVQFQAKYIRQAYYIFILLLEIIGVSIITWWMLFLKPACYFLHYCQFSYA